MKQPLNRYSFVFLLLLLSSTPACAQSDLLGLSLEELMNIEITSAAKKPERYFDTATALYVITQEDIRRSGATNIPELLRMVPGISVQKLDSNTWDISARGFNGSLFANKLLVLIDGRSVYTPLFGGVFWDVQDVVLEDVERIEVIRGPGGTVWGANAVNGVINVITKKAADTQGLLVVAGGGSEERGFSTTRYGDQAGDWAYRAYTKYFDRDEGYSIVGNEIDNWWMKRAGFRADNGGLTFQGDFYAGEVDQKITLVSFGAPFAETSNESVDVQGWNLMSKYQGDDWFVQLYWDVTNRYSKSFKERRDKIDLEYTRLLHPTENQEFSWGAGFRVDLESISNTATVTVRESERLDRLFHMFFQDEIKLMDDKLKLIAGSKFEHNIYTGFEFQPNARALYKFNDNNSIWVAASRAVRTPSRVETDADLTVFAGLLTRQVGDRTLAPEIMNAYELGYRTQPRENMIFDLTAYSNHYDQLVVFKVGDLIFEHGAFVFLLPDVNGASGEVHGVEASGDIKITDWWGLKASYTFAQLNLRADSDINDLGLSRVLQHSTPRHGAYIRNSFDLPHGFEVDTNIRYSDVVKSGKTPQYIELDLRLAKKIKDWEIALVGQNLVEAKHWETKAGAPTQIERSWYLKFTGRF